MTAARAPPSSSAAASPARPRPWRSRRPASSRPSSRRTPPAPTASACSSPSARTASTRSASSTRPSPSLAAGFPTPRITLRSGTGKRLGESRIGVALPDGATSQTLKRADLYRALHEQALARGVRIEHGKRLVAAHETGDGVRAVFADGSEATGDVLIGCDGIRSTVRRIIDSAAPAPAYSGLLTTGGFVRGVGRRRRAGRLRDDLRPARVLRPRAGARRGGVVVRQRAAARRAGGRRAARDQRRRLAPPAAGALRRRRRAGGRARRATTELMPMSPIHAMPRLPAWHRGRMIVIGDAAHAPSPTSGQGASLSVEDAVVLAQSLRDAPGPRSRSPVRGRAPPADRADRQVGGPGQQQQGRRPGRPRRYATR